MTHVSRRFGVWYKRRASRESEGDSVAPSSRLVAVLLCALAPAAAAAQASAKPAAAPAKPAAAPAPGTVVTDAADLEVKTLEERVNEIKERIHRSKARLQGLQEMAIGGDLAAGAKAAIVHRNEMGASFVLEAVTFALDGAPVYARSDAAGELDRREEIPVFEGRLAPGSHQLSVRLVYRGRGGGGEAPRIKVQSAYTFLADAGKLTRLAVVAVEKSGADIRERPSVRYDLDVRPDEPARRPAKPGAGGAAK
jgi:3-oxoacyl-ACP reductase-like protein